MKSRTFDVNFERLITLKFIVIPSAINQVGGWEINKRTLSANQPKIFTGKIYEAVHISTGMLISIRKEPAIIKMFSRFHKKSFSGETLGKKESI